MKLQTQALNTSLLISALLAGTATGVAAESTAGNSAETRSQGESQAQTQTSGTVDSTQGDTSGNATVGSNTGSDRDDGDFDVLDTNNDGRLDREELREGGREHRSSDIEGVDGIDRDTFYRYQGGQSE